MKIKERANDSMELRFLDYGDVFRANGSLWMVTDRGTEECVSAVRLATGYTTHMSRTCVVTLVDGTFVEGA